MKKKLAALLLVLCALGVYAPALRNDFVWDDHALILRDPLIRSWQLIGEGFTHFLFTDAAASDFYRPLQRLSYTLDYAAFFLSPMGYHLVSLLWHAAAAVALFFFAEEFLARCWNGSAAPELGRIWRGAGLGVASGAERGGRLRFRPGRSAGGGALVFSVSISACACCARRETGAGDLGSGAGLSFLASALSKEAGLIFLLVWLIIALAQRPRRALLGTTGLLAGVLCAYLSLRLPAEHQPAPVAPAAPLLVRPIVASRAVAEYAGLLAFPWRLHMERDVETRPTGYDPESMAAASWRELQTLLGLAPAGGGRLSALADCGGGPRSSFRSFSRWSAICRSAD